MLLEDHPVRNIRNPLDYRHLKFIKNTFYLTALWPNFQGKKSLRKLILICSIYFYYMTSIYMNFMYLYQNFETLTFFDTGLMYLTIFLMSTSFSRCIDIPLKAGYSRLTKKLITEFHLYYFRNESEYARTVHAKVHRISHFLTVYYVGVTFVGTTLFNLCSIYINYEKGLFGNNKIGNATYVLSLYYALPWDANKNLNGYIGAVLYNWSVSIICGIYLIVLDLFISLMVLQVWGHIKILLTKLENFPRPVKETLRDRLMSKVHYFDETETDLVKAKLKDVINYYEMIMTFTNEMSDVFGATLFIFYAFHQISGCLLLLEVSPLTVEAILSYGFLTATEYQLLIQLSVIFESIGIVSEKIKDGVYNLPWECMDAKCKNVVLIFLYHVKDPIHLKALGFTEVGVTTMANIIKTSFSYFLFLRTMN